MSANTPLFGAHMSVAGGLENALTAGLDVGCDCVQIFVKNQRQWKARTLTDEQISVFKAKRRETGLSPVMAHASYLLNLASPDREIRRKSRLALLDELTRCEALGVDALVLHPGSRMDGEEKEALRRVSDGLSAIHGKTPGFACRVLLETTAGQGRTVGHRFEHIAEIIQNTRENERLGICLDTCHLFAAGFDFRKPSSYEGMIRAMDEAFGIDRIRCIHANDSKGGLGSRLDRHEHIGKGRIGKDGFRHFVNDRRFAGLPMILETEKGEDGRGVDLDKVNLKRLRSLIE